MLRAVIAIAWLLAQRVYTAHFFLRLFSVLLKKIPAFHLFPRFFCMQGLAYSTGFYEGQGGTSNFQPI